MDLLEQSEQTIVDYVKLSSQEYLLLRDKLISILKRLEPESVPNYIGFEHEFDPVKIRIESKRFFCELNVMVEDEN